MPVRREKFERTRPDGVVVVVDRNLDTGEHVVSVKDTKSGSASKAEPKKSDTKSGSASK